MTTFQQFDHGWKGPWDLFPDPHAVANRRAIAKGRTTCGIDFTGVAMVLVHCAAFPFSGKASRRLSEENRLFTT
jgi:hypothetical protein